jgi:hypothetical protein
MNKIVKWIIAGASIAVPVGIIAIDDLLQRKESKAPIMRIEWRGYLNRENKCHKGLIDSIEELKDLIAESETEKKEGKYQITPKHSLSIGFLFRAMYEQAIKSILKSYGKTCLIKRQLNEKSVESILNEKPEMHRVKSYHDEIKCSGIIEKLNDVVHDSNKDENAVANIDREHDVMLICEFVQETIYAIGEKRNNTASS